MFVYSKNIICHSTSTSTSCVTVCTGTVYTVFEHCRRYVHVLYVECVIQPPVPPGGSNWSDTHSARRVVLVQQEPNVGNVRWNIHETCECETWNVKCEMWNVVAHFSFSFGWFMYVYYMCTPSTTGYTHSHTTLVHLLMLTVICSILPGYIIVFYDQVPPYK